MQVLNAAVLNHVAGGMRMSPLPGFWQPSGPPQHPNDHGGGIYCAVYKGDEVYAEYQKRLDEYNAANPKAA